MFLRKRIQFVVIILIIAIVECVLEDGESGIRIPDGPLKIEEILKR